MLRTKLVLSADSPTLPASVADSASVVPLPSEETLFPLLLLSRGVIFTLSLSDGGVTFTAHALLGEGQTNQNFLNCPLPRWRALRYVWCKLRRR